MGPGSAEGLINFGGPVPQVPAPQGCWWDLPLPLSELKRKTGPIRGCPGPRYDTKLWMRDLKEGAAYLPK